MADIDAKAIDVPELVSLLKTPRYFSDAIMAARTPRDEETIAYYRENAKRAATALEALQAERDAARMQLGNLATVEDVREINDLNRALQAENTRLAKEIEVQRVSKKYAQRCCEAAEAENTRLGERIAELERGLPRELTIKQKVPGVSAYTKIAGGCRPVALAAAWTAIVDELSARSLSKEPTGQSLGTATGSPLLSDPACVSSPHGARGSRESAPFIPEHKLALATFLGALDEWGCEDNDQRAEQIAAFISSGFDLSEYADFPALRLIQGGKEP